MLFPQKHPLLWVLISTVVCNALLFLSSPNGMLEGGTLVFYQLAEHFSVHAPNMNDWVRMPVFPFVMHTVLSFPHPGMWIVLLHLTLSVLSTLVLYSVCTMLVGNRHDAADIAISFVFLQVLLMRAFFLQVVLLADTLYTQLLLLGVLICIAGWKKRCFGLEIAGYIVLGIALATRSIGISSIPVLIAWMFYTQKHRTLPWLKTIPVFVLSLLLPLVLWSGRNAMLYGYFSPSALGFHNMLVHKAIPLLTEHDTVFDTPEKQQAFMDTVGALRQQTYTNKWAYWYYGCNVGGTCLHEFFLAYPPKLPGGLGADHEHYWFNAFSFGVERESRDISLTIIRKHPVAYAYDVIRTYMELFRTTLHPQVFPLKTIYAKPVYNAQTGKTGEMIRALYANSGTHLAPASAYVYSVLSTLNTMHARSMWGEWFGTVFFILLHAMMFANVYLLMASGYVTDTTLRGILSCSLLLFAIVAAHTLLIAMTIYPGARFGAWTEPELLLFVLLSVWTYKKLYTIHGAHRYVTV